MMDPQKVKRIHFINFVPEKIPFVKGIDRNSGKED